MPDASSNYLNFPTPKAYELEARWHIEGFRTCKECEGDGYTEDMGDKFTCTECSGSGEVKLTFMDWLEAIEVDA